MPADPRIRPAQHFRQGTAITVDIHPSELYAVFHVQEVSESRLKGSKAKGCVRSPVTRMYVVTYVCVVKRADAAAAVVQ